MDNYHERRACGSCEVKIEIPVDLVGGIITIYNSLGELQFETRLNNAIENFDFSELNSALILLNIRLRLKYLMYNL